MACESIQNLAVSYITGKLLETKLAEIHAHLNTCSDCREHYQLTKLVHKAVNEILPSDEHFDHLWQDILRQHEEQHQQHRPAQMSTLAAFVKLVLDIAISLILMPFWLPLVTVISLLIKATSSGPAFHRQMRVGKGGRTFILYKFRTLREPKLQSSAETWALRIDRATPIGRWLRRTRLDDLPQFFNVLKGDISLIGPRPERPEILEKLCQYEPSYAALYTKFRPGLLTPRVSQQYENEDDELAVAIQYLPNDLHYIHNWSFFLDLRIAAAIAARAIRIDR